MEIVNKYLQSKSLIAFLDKSESFSYTTLCIQPETLLAYSLYKHILVFNYNNQSKLATHKDDFLDFDRMCHVCGEHESEIIQIYKSKWYKCGFSTLGFCNACFLGSNSEHQTPFLLTSSRDKCDHCENRDTYIVDYLFTGKTKTLCSNDHFYSSSPAKIVCVSYTPSPNPMKKIKEEYLKHKNTKTSPTSHCSRV
jgi:hypothetical protein